MDSAFERRFLYKLEFEKPTVEVKSAIWLSMIAGLNAEDAHTLASMYDFSGGQIENIARKSIVSRILKREQMSLNTIISHCNTESISNVSHRKIGF